MSKLIHTEIFITIAMEPNSKLNPQNLQNLHDFEWPFHEDLFPFDKTLDFPPLDLDHFFDLHSLSSPFHWDNQYNIFSPETEIFSPEKQTTIPLDQQLYEYDHTAFAGEVEPVRAMIKSKEEDERSIREMEEVTMMIERGFPISWEYDVKRERIMRTSNGRRKRSKSSVLELKEIQKHFHIPISEAAKQMNVGLTLLKKRCRELNIMRWPHRKIKSLKSLIQNVKVMGLTNEVNGLEKHKRLVEELPNMDLTCRTKRLRQACFKANYKIKRRSNIAAIH